MRIIKAGVSTLNSKPGDPVPTTVESLITSTATAAGTPAAVRDQDTGSREVSRKTAGTPAA
jgi:hypothetical protein